MKTTAARSMGFVIALMLTLSACNGSETTVRRDPNGVCMEHRRTWDFGFQTGSYDRPTEDEACASIDRET